MARPRQDRATYSDTSGQQWGTCPLCTEVVAVSEAGRIEIHAELIRTALMPRLGGRCRASGFNIDDYKIGARP